MRDSIDTEAIKQAALDLLRFNRKEGYDSRYKRKFNYSSPSRRRYSWQWFWDSCFHAIALSHLDLQMAKDELSSLVASQEDDGFIGHITYWGSRPVLPPWAYLQSKISLRPRHSQLIQPPLLAQAVHQVYLKSQDRAFLDDMLPRLDRYYWWLADKRDPDADSLISVISPYETGMDHKPAFDSALGLRRPGRASLEIKNRLLDISHLARGNYDVDAILRKGVFDCEDVMVNCVYAQALASMGRMHQETGSDDKARAYEALAHRVERAVLDKCYDPESGLYFDLFSRSERKLKVATVTALFPLILDTIPNERLDELVHRHLLNEEEFWLPNPVPSVAMSEVTFKPDWSMTLWRGPAWLNTNWFLVQGLRKHGYGDAAKHIVDRSLEMVAREGFREYYNPITGKGMGAGDFGWSTLVVDMVS